ncbi:2Fe-2S iron-sulfur cluster binding domain-containing protein [Vibrio gazogenes]|uniref:Carbapenem biosynthesis protein CpmE n=1 Tax=Vibrio gazogenes DSM 21264 = NBRC 103151 TaxID=1123492 RepID=A0A1M5A0I3_VIBGA|nr:2Fe-2S iron-sulfur cluster binding domain-containing protein [Vibrio gazogenes]USP13402.1 2Fe-2S iron-sulfur cluster binding domain-containing protein [Vibrio gazogenes]SHF23617.1 carbapenem biosynthesis protein CpmE [Vibrio gazogenes DSM 21264] [Vibrio gazogenes DSM 21264 = NBRC 103151]SJN58387.1 CDP-6-deoxy-L-threo-D-glycero-4-hexulose-3-dehydrase reductase [Vibrio gazogenes]
MQNNKCIINEEIIEFPLDKENSILDTALKHGIDLHYNCQAGFCGRCKVLLKKGQVDMDHSGGISRTEIKERYILACCSTPLTPIEIEVVN